MKPESVLIRLGYTPAESRVYLAALELASGTISDFTKHTGLPRTSVAFAVQSLYRRGLLVGFLKKKERIWSAESPHKILKKLQMQEEELKTVIPHMQELHIDTGKKPVMSVHAGHVEVLNILDDIISTGQNVLAIASTDAFQAIYGPETMHKFIEQRRSHTISIRLVTAPLPMALEQLKRNTRELRNTRFFTALGATSSMVYIYDDKVSISSINRAQPTGVIIRDKDFNIMMRTIFETMWAASKILEPVDDEDTEVDYTRRL